MELAITPELQEKWDALVEKEKGIRADLRELDKQKQAICSEVFKRTIEQGRWFVCENGVLAPQGVETEALLDDLISSSLGIAYHGTFVVDMGGVPIMGSLDDGALRLYLLLRSPDSEKYANLLTVENVEFRQGVLGQVKTAMRKEEREITAHRQSSGICKLSARSTRGVPPRARRRRSEAGGSMSSIWMKPVCAGCGEEIDDRAKIVAIVPGTSRASSSWASGHEPERGWLRLMPSKGRKNQQEPLMFHERCWVKIVPGQVKPEPKRNPNCPYPHLHASDCDCRGEGGPR